MRSATLILTLLAVVVLCSSAVAQAGGPFAKGNKETLVCLDLACLANLEIKFNLNAQTTGNGTVRGHSNLEVTDASDAALVASPFAEDGFSKAKSKCLAIETGGPLGTVAVVSGEITSGQSALTGDDVSDQCFIGAAYDGAPVGGPDLVSLVFYYDCDDSAPEDACTDAVLIAAISVPPSPGLSPIGTVTKGDIRVKP